MTQTAARHEQFVPREDALRIPAFAMLSYWALMAGVALAPYMFWRFHPDIQFTFSDACFAVAFFFAVLSGRLNTRPLSGMTAWWILAFSLMLLALGASSFVNGDPIRFGISGSQYFFSYLLMPFLVLLARAREQMRLIMIFVASVVVAEAFSIAMFYLYGEIPQALDWINHNFVTGAGRLGSFFGSANRNAAVISLTLPFAMYLARTGQWPIWVSVPCLGVLALALILTASFTGLVSGLGAAVFFVVAAYGKQSWKAVVVAVALLGAGWASGLSLPETFENRVLGALESGDISEAGTYTGRMELIEEAVSLSDDANLLGLGADQFRAVSDLGAPVHNVYLLIWTEGGVFSLLGWLLGMGVFAWIALRSVISDRTAGALVLSVGLAFLIITNASTHVYARMWTLPFLFAASVGMLAIDGRLRFSGKQQDIAQSDG